MTADHVAATLRHHPFPGAIVHASPSSLYLTVDGRDLHYYGVEWQVGDRLIPASWPTLDSPDDGDRVHAEIRRVLATLDEDRRRDAEQALAKMTDAHAVVSQRLAGSQKEVAEVSAERDEATARATKAEARVKRLRKSINAAHDVLDEAGIGLEPEGSPRWTLARRCRAAVAPVWGYLDALQAFDVVGEIVGVTGKTGERGFIDAVIARVKALRNDDDTRAAIAVAVGLDGSASLALILDTVPRDRPAREISRLSGLLDVFAAPVAFGERRLSTVERAEWALRRALRERDECAPRMAQLIDAEVCLDTLGVPAYAAIPSDDPGDASEALTVAERIRLHFGAQS